MAKKIKKITLAVSEETGDNKPDSIKDAEKKAKPIFEKWSMELRQKATTKSGKGMIVSFRYDFRKREEGFAIQMIRETAETMGLKSVIFKDENEDELSYYLEIER